MAFSEGPRFATSGNGRTLDPRLLTILKTAAQAYGLDVQATSGVQARSTGTKNHPGGYAIDVQLIDPSTGKVLPNYHQDLPNSFPAYEKFAQTARVVQQQLYPELNDTFRWGGYFRSGVNPADLMHFDINPSMKGAMAGGSWEGGVDPSFAKSIGVSNYNPGLGSLDGQRQVAMIRQSMSRGPLPPANIPQAGTALDTIDRAFPRAMPPQIASAYAPTSQPPMPRPLPAPPPLRAPTPTTFGGRLADLAMNGQDRLVPGQVTLPPTDFAANTGVPDIRALGMTTPSPNIMGSALVPLPRPRPVLGSDAPVPMPGRPPALSMPATAPQIAPQPVPRPLAPSVAPQRSSVPAAPQLRLASGKTIAPGIYDQGDHSVRVSDDGNGNAVVERVRGPMAVPGVFDPLREANANTIAGGYIRSMLPQVASSAVSGFMPTVDRAKTAALGAISNLGAQAQQFGGGLFGGLFGRPALPRPMNLPPVPMPGRPAALSSRNSGPSSDQRGQAALRAAGMLDQFGMIR